MRNDVTVTRIEKGPKRDYIFFTKNCMVFYVKILVFSLWLFRYEKI